MSLSVSAWKTSPERGLAGLALALSALEILALVVLLSTLII